MSERHDTSLLYYDKNFAEKYSMETREENGSCFKVLDTYGITAIRLFTATVAQRNQLFSPELLFSEKTGNRIDILLTCIAIVPCQEFCCSSTMVLSPSYNWGQTR
jgi:hypothetical protein